MKNAEVIGRLQRQVTGFACDVRSCLVSSTKARVGYEKRNCKKDAPMLRARSTASGDGRV